jgi:GDP-L-fucose synthase
VGTGKDIAIKELVDLLVGVIGYRGQIKWDTSKPDGTPRKLLNVEKIATLGWLAMTKLSDGLELTYQSYLNAIR